MQLMLAACFAYLLPFWPIHPPASAVHTSTSSRPMAGKAFAYSPDCQSRIIANYSFKVSLSESGITGQLRWIGIPLHAPPVSTHGHVERHLGLFDLVAVGVGGTLGTG